MEETGRNYFFRAEKTVENNRGFFHFGRNWRTLNTEIAVPYRRYLHTGYGIFHCDSVKHKIELQDHWITIYKKNGDRMTEGLKVDVFNGT